MGFALGFGQFSKFRELTILWPLCWRIIYPESREAETGCRTCRGAGVAATRCLVTHPLELECTQTPPEYGHNSKH